MRMGERYDRIRYSQHALDQFVKRPAVVRADVELALNEGTVRKGDNSYSVCPCGDSCFLSERS